MVDPVRLAQVDPERMKVLRVREHRGGGTCVLCGAELQPHEWVVSLPERLGTAQTHCAGDAGWAVQ
jgi:hypothetical protein